MSDGHSMHYNPLKNLFLLFVLITHFRHLVADEHVKQYKIFVSVQV